MHQPTSSLLTALLLPLAGCATLSDAPDFIGPPPAPPAQEVDDAPPLPEAPVVVETPRPPPDPIPDRLGTPSTSRAAAPAWWLVDHPFGYLPRPEAPWQFDPLAESAPREAPTLDNGALLCDVNVGGYRGDATEAGEYAGTDLTVGASVGGARPPARELWVWGVGPEDTGTARVLIPLIDLKPGATLHFKFNDRDVLFDDDLELVAHRWTGQVPFEFKGRIGRGRCRFVPRAPLDQAVALRLEDVDNALAAVPPASAPDLTRASLRSTETEQLGGVKVAIASVASLVGWDDPRVARRLERMGVLVAQRHALLVTALDATRADAESLGAWQAPAEGKVSMRLGVPLCGKTALKPLRKHWTEPWTRVGATTCALQLELRNDAAETVGVVPSRRALGSIEELAWVGGDGDVAVLSVVAVRAGDRLLKPTGAIDIAPGESIVLVLPAPAWFEPSNGGMLRTVARGDDRKPWTDYWRSP